MQVAENTDIVYSEGVADFTTVSNSSFASVTFGELINATTIDPIIQSAVSYYAIALPLGCLIVLANVLTLCYLVFQKLLRHPANHYVASLALADSGVGIFLVVFNFTLDPYDSLQNCLLHLCFVSMICLVSIFSILAIAVDRYIFLVKAIYYYQRATFRHSVIIVAITWVTGAMVGFIPMMGVNQKTLNGRCSVLNAINPVYIMAMLTLFLFIPLVTIVVLYGRILHLAIQQRRKFLKQTQRFDPDASRASSAYSWRGIAILRGLRAAKVVISVVGIFLVTWIPYFISVFVEIVCGVNCQVADTVSSYLMLLGCLNSLLNPCVYAFFGMEIRGLKCFSCMPYIRILPRLETVAWRVL